MRARSQRATNRPPAAPRGMSRTRAQLSSEMTRLEFERERLVRDLAMLLDRVESSERSLRRVDDRLTALQAELAL